MMPKSPVTILLLVSVAASGAIGADVPWLGPNLLANPSFEAVSDAGTPLAWSVSPSRDGATAGVDSAVALQARSALRLTATAKGAHVAATSDPVPVEGGAIYLVSLGFRQEGFNRSGAPDSYEGVSSYPRLLWLDEARKQVGASKILSRFPYGASPWDLRDALEAAPATARFAQVLVAISQDDGRKDDVTASPSTLWVDAVQLRRYQPPPTPAWAVGESTRIVEGGIADTRLLSFFLGSDEQFHSRDGKWSRTTPDSQAERGVALAAPAGVGEGIMAHSPYFPALPPGLYRLRVRAKFATTAAAPPGYADVISESAGTRLVLDLAPPSAAKPDTYATSEADFVLRDSGWWCLRLFTLGKEAWAIDSCKILPLHEFEDRQLLAAYPGSTGELPAELKPARFLPALGGAPKPMKVLAVAGMGHERYRLAAVIHVLHRDAQASAVWVRMDRGRMRFSGLPEDPRRLFEYPVVVLCDVSARCLTLKVKNALCEYVRRGGALVVLGGHQAYERGGWAGSMLEDVLPVTVATKLPGGVHAFPSPQPLVLAPDLPGGDGLRGSPLPVVTYLHRVQAKPGAHVWVSAGGEPFLVAGSAGEGRVVCVLGIPWGEEGGQTLPFWAWDGWVHLLREVIWWAARMPALQDLTPASE